jgi:putative FmdB family regulatory protein
MPFYDYRCSECEHIFNEMLKIAEMEKPISEPCPNCKKEGCIKRFFGTDSATPLHSGIGLGNNRVPDGFKEVLKNIRKNNIHSRIDTK